MGDVGRDMVDHTAGDRGGDHVAVVGVDSADEGGHVERTPFGHAQHLPQHRRRVDGVNSGVLLEAAQVGQTLRRLEESAVVLGGLFRPLALADIHGLGQEPRRRPIGAG